VTPVSETAGPGGPLSRCTRVDVVTAAGGGGDGRDAPPQGSAARRPTYEQARDELSDVVKRMEAGGLTLEQSLQLWERGERLAAVCTEWLEGARARLAEAMAQRAEGGKGGEGGEGEAPF
jgi:exodeoxyribonuclease VII small subunit